MLDINELRKLGTIALLSILGEELEIRKSMSGLDLKQILDNCKHKNGSI